MKASARLKKTVEDGTDERMWGETYEEKKRNVEIEMLKDRKRRGSWVQSTERAKQLPQDVNLLLSKHGLQGQFSNCN